MTGFLKVIGLLAVVLHCNGLRPQQSENYGNNKAVFRLQTGRRYAFPEGSVIIGAPAYPNHLPEAEAILPGHTLIRPGLGMLKSAIKFPHRELEGGSGVYGNWDNLGIRYDGKNERVLYTGFRRSNSNDPIVVFLPSESRSNRAETKKERRNELLSRIIQDMLKNSGHRRNSKSTFENRYSSEENITMSKIFESLKDLIPKDIAFFPLVIHINDSKILNQAIDRVVRKLNLKGLSKNINDILCKLKSQRRYKINDKNVKQNYEKDAVRLDLKFYDQHHNKVNYKNKFTLSDKKHMAKDEVIESSSGSESEETNKQFNTASPSNSKTKTDEEKRQELFWQTKDAGNHIKISDTAPDFESFLPKFSEKKDMEQIQSWWYFNQADHTQLQEKRRHE